VAAFQRATQLDPDFALAHAGIALAYAPMLTWGMIPPEDGVPPLEAAAARAAELDNSLPEVQLALAQVASLRWDWDEELRAYQRAIALDPNVPKVYAWYGFALAVQGRVEEGLAMRQRAFEMDPTGLVTKINLAGALMSLGRHDEALAQLESTLELEPDYYWALILRGSMHVDRGELAEAVSLFEKAGAWTLQVCALARSGHPEAGRRILEERLAAAAAGEYVSEYHLALAHGALGDVERAFELLEVAYQKRLWGLSLMGGAWELTGLRTDPRFADLLHRLGLPLPATSSVSEKAHPRPA